MKNICFINQSSGPLFENIAVDVSRIFTNSLLLSGNFKNHRIFKNDNKYLEERYLNPYIRKNKVTRLFSGILFVYKTFVELLKYRPKLILFVSNPPFIGLFIFIISKFIKIKYILLIYDIYPDILVSTGTFKENNLIVKLWRNVNKIVYENSVGVITIGESMGNVLEKQFDSTRTNLGKVEVIHNCADGDIFMPASSKYFMQTKADYEAGLIIVYSGNFGFSHDFDAILDAIKKLETNSHKFYLVGDGAKKQSVDYRIKSENITNIVSRNYFEESEFPQFISSADIALITMSNGCEEFMVPSKIYISMAVGSALIGITGDNSDLAKLIRQHECGIVVPVGDAPALKSAIEKFSKNRDYLERCKINSFSAFRHYYTREHTSQKYIDLISKFVDIDEQ